jgi:hypothetical protein
MAMSDSQMTLDQFLRELRGYGNLLKTGDITFKEYRKFVEYVCLVFRGELDMRFEEY